MCSPCSARGGGGRRGLDRGCSPLAAAELVVGVAVEMRGCLRRVELHDAPIVVDVHRLLLLPALHGLCRSMCASRMLRQTGTAQRQAVQAACAQRATDGRAPALLQLLSQGLELQALPDDVEAAGVEDSGPLLELEPAVAQTEEARVRLQLEEARVRLQLLHAARAGRRRGQSLSQRSGRLSVVGVTVDEEVRQVSRLPQRGREGRRVPPVVLGQGVHGVDVHDLQDLLLLRWRQVNVVHGLHVVPPPAQRGADLLLQPLSDRRAHRHPLQLVKDGLAQHVTQLLLLEPDVRIGRGDDDGGSRNMAPHCLKQPDERSPVVLRRRGSESRRHWSGERSVTDLTTR